jgi:pimeloyl-ACP methyl ester carboxylesterase
MPASVHLDLGQGPDVVLVHGVGAGPETFTPVVDLLADRHRCVVVDRPGGGGGPAVPLLEQADQVAELLTELGIASGRFVGVSGGATLGLLLAIRHPGSFADYVLHEPLVGHHAPDLHARFTRAAARAALGPDATMAVVREVMGEGAWEALGPDGRRSANGQVDRWRAEIAAFAAFDPSAADLASLRTRALLVTVGGRSGPERQAAADALRHVAGASLAVVPESGNAAQVDAPAAFAKIIRSRRSTPVGGPR